MHDPEVLAGVYKRNQWVINKQTKSLTHADSLLQPDMRGNCLNYVLGHMLVHREKVMKMLSLEPLTSEEQFERYNYDSDPVTEDGPGVILLDELVVLLEKSADILAEKIMTLSPEKLAVELEMGESTETLANRIEFYSWHDTYHVGQTEYLRQLADVDDRVI